MNGAALKRRSICNIAFLKTRIPRTYDISWQRNVCPLLFPQYRALRTRKSEKGAAFCILRDCQLVRPPRQLRASPRRGPFCDVCKRPPRKNPVCVRILSAASILTDASPSSPFVLYHTGGRLGVGFSAVNPTEREVSYVLEDRALSVSRVIPNVTGSPIALRTFESRLSPCPGFAKTSIATHPPPPPRKAFGPLLFD